MLQLPLDPKTLYHKHGGIIRRIHSIAHEIAKPRGGLSQDAWWYVCTVKWDDGELGEGVRVPPYMIICDDGANNLELNQLSELMDSYLRKHGSFNMGADTTKPRGWTAKRHSKLVLVK